MNIYKENLTRLNTESGQLTRKDRRISTARLLLIITSIFLIYNGLYNKDWIFFLLAGLVFVAFLFLIKIHTKVRWQIRLVEELSKINLEEIAFLETGTKSFDGGAAFIDTNHPYSYDLDLFGEHSLFQYLNRTGTVLGKTSLGNGLLQQLAKEEIENYHSAIKELSPEVEWRQNILAQARIHPDSDESLNDLMTWAKKKPIGINKITGVLLYIIPLITILSFGLYFFTPFEIFWRFGLLGFLINLGILASYGLTIKNELIPTTKIERILSQYAHFLKIIEESSFTSKKLKTLQRQLINNGNKSSKSIQQLSLLFGRMEHITNAFASPILNGLILYHIHVMRGLSQWRIKHNSEIDQWLKVIGEFEKLNSIANFSYNNPSFTFPDINEDRKILFEELGHPLIERGKNITNSIDFCEHPFFILTGSNMSGKSTFLRTLGVNMVLASIGAPVFAKKALIHPLPVLVSMRLTDSLNDSESYFYAEVKRLKSIVDQLDQDTCFILLDEILRGTNSDDKRNGTIEVIRKMAQKKALGGIATHDLEVCKIADEYPNELSNKRFEVEIVNDELVFDYKLQDWGM